MNKMPPKRTSATAKLLARGTTAEVKLPPFSADMPGVWFKQFESYLTAKCITNSGLWFLHAPFSLSTDKKRQVRDLLEINPPPVDAYFQPGKCLLHLYESDQTSSICKLFKIPPLGGQHPLELPAKMRLLCPEKDQEGHLLRDVQREAASRHAEPAGRGTSRL